MSHTRELQAIRQRYEEGLAATAVPVFTRGEVGILLAEIDRLGQSQRALRRSINASPTPPKTKVINGTLHEQRPDGNWQAVMGLE